MSENEIKETIKIKRVSKINLSKEARENNPYKGYETYFVILSEDNRIFQYCTGNNQSRIVSKSNELIALIQKEDEVTISYIEKLNQSIDKNENIKVNKIIKIIDVIFK